MNDFTKEELIWMSSRIFYGMETNIHGKMIHGLRKKIQSLIDNYNETQNIENVRVTIEYSTIISIPWSSKK